MRKDGPIIPFHSLPPDDQARLKHFETLRKSTFPRAVETYLTLMPLVVPHATKEDIEHMRQNIAERSVTRKKKQHFVETTRAICYTLLGIKRDDPIDPFELVIATRDEAYEATIQSASVQIRLYAEALHVVDDSEKLNRGIDAILRNNGNRVCPDDWKAAKQLFDLYPETFGVVTEDHPQAK